VAVIVAASWLSACGPEPAGDRPLAQAYEYEPVGRTIQWNASPAARFGVSAKDFASPPMGEGEQGGGLAWDAPPGWTKRPPAQFRDANFYVAGDERAECYLTTLSGEAGGLAANVNRWRAQVSLPSLSAEEIAKLQRVSWLGGEAVYVDFEGEWKGMSGDQMQVGWRLVGLLLVQPSGSLFLKMVGPSDVIGREVEAFRKLAASFREGGAPRAHTQEPSMPQGLPDGHPPVEPAAPVAQSGEDVQSNENLAWHSPAGWKRGAAKSMREVTYFAGEKNDVECYVTLLGGTGGGLLANVNRWCTQMGAPQLAESDLAKLEHVTMAGSDGVVVELVRGEGATAAAGQELLLGAVCLLSERALFVKMTGPASAVQAQRAKFVEFCKSLQSKP